MRRSGGPAILLSITALTIGVTGSWAALTPPTPVTQVNTDFVEAQPFPSFDGRTLYFIRSHTDAFSYARIYVAHREESSDVFTSVEELSALNYSGGHVASPWVSPDNLRMYYYRTEPGNMGLGFHRIKLTERASVNDPWVPGGNVEELNSFGAVSSLSLTEDELTIVFTGNSQIPGGHGSYDLWIASRATRNEPFGDIQNLAELNSVDAETTPALTPDGLTMYFTSHRTGSGRLFKTSREDAQQLFDTPEQIVAFDDPDVVGLSGGTPSSDGKEFFFSRTDASHTDDADIWVSYSRSVFSRFEPRVAGLEIREEGAGTFSFIGEYDIGKESDGILVDFEEVEISFGGYAETIPAGAFKCAGFVCRYESDGPGVVAATIDGRTMNVRAAGIDLSSIPNPLPIAMTVGDDFGELSVRLRGTLFFTEDGGGDGDEDRVEREFDREDGRRDHSTDFNRVR